MSNSRTFYERATLVLVLVSGLLLCATGAHAAMIQQWVASHNGIGNADDVGYDVASDAVGNTYVTGRSTNGAGVPEVLIAKYDASGAQVWAQSWDSSSHNGALAYSIVLDADNNIYVAGNTNSGVNLMALLLKYNSDGVFQWQAIYDSGNDFAEFRRVALDGQGNVYAAGTTLTTSANTDYLIAKYNPAGAQQWVHTDNGPGDRDDQAFGLVVDADGNSYMNGYQWTGTDNYDAALVKYDSSGSFQWKKLLNGTAAVSSDFGGSAILNSAGNVYFTADLYNSTTGYDLAVAYVDAANTTSWVQTYDGPAHSDDYTPELIAMWCLFPFGFGVRGVALGPNDSVYFTGTVYDAGFNQTIVVAKYDSTGNQQWASLFHNSGTSYDYSSSIAVDAVGNAFVTGFTTPDDFSTTQYVTVMYDAEGSLVDSKTFDGPGGGSGNLAENIALDADGNPVVTGIAYQGDDEQNNAYTIKYCVGCLISGVCYPDGTTQVGNVCLVCNAATSQTDWSNNDGASCDDGLWCNGADTCASGACTVHEFDNVTTFRCPDDGLFCDGTESCDETTDACVSSGNPCSADETCDETTDTCVPNGDDDTAADDDATDDDAADDDAADDDVTDDDAADDDTAPTDDDTIDDDSTGGGGSSCCGC